MNACVARAHAQVINRLSPSCAYVDACDVNCFRYAEMVREHLAPECEIVSEHHADEKFMVVSAASIVAKVVRDRADRESSEKNTARSGAATPRTRSLFSGSPAISGITRRHPLLPAELEDGERSLQKRPSAPCWISKKIRRESPD